MDDTKGMGLFGYIILFVIIVWVFGAFNGNGFGLGGWGNRAVAHGFDYSPVNYGFEDYRQICEAEKASITRTATTQYLIEQQGALTRENATANANMLATKIDFYEYQNLRDQLAESNRKVMQLENQVYNDAKFNALTAQISDIRCNMLQKPQVTGVSTSCNPIITPSLASYLNSGCGCGCGTVV